MTTIKDLARILVSQHRIKGEDAELFISQFVEIINEGLIADRQVKIKGFGTFKLQTVKERSSVSVSTGERVTKRQNRTIPAAGNSPAGIFLFTLTSSFPLSNINVSLTYNCSRSIYLYVSFSRNVPRKT